MEWTIEYRNLKKLALYSAWQHYDLTFCKHCNQSILVDELLNHVICNSYNVYFNKEIYGDSTTKLRCTYKSENDININFVAGRFRDIE
jgi:hypothetical protein